MLVNVLMCTYNGEKYIKEQIDSILNQTHEDLCLYIRDDGSTDQTLEIIAEYERNNPGRVVVMDPLKHLGYPDCFWDILARCPKADYYAFSDQDDVWDERKLECAVELLGSSFDATKKPLLFIHDYEICDGIENVTGVHRLSDAGTADHTRVMFYTIAQGFSFVINSAMRDHLVKQRLFGRDISHDQWIIWNAVFSGEIVSDARLLAKYRRHESTVTKSGANVIVMLDNWIKNEIFGDEFSRQCARLRAYIAENGSGMSAKERTDWEILSGAKSGAGAYFKRLFFGKRLRPSLAGELALRFNFLIGMK